MAKILYQCDICEDIYDTREKADKCCSDVIRCEECGKTFLKTDVINYNKCCIVNDVSEMYNDLQSKIIYGVYRSEIEIELVDYINYLAFELLEKNEDCEVLSIGIEDAYDNQRRINLDYKSLSSLIEHLKMIKDNLDTCKDKAKKLTKERKKHVR